MHDNVVDQTSEAIPLEELARRFGITRSNVRVWAMKQKFTFVKKRLAENGNHLILALTPKEAARAVALRKSLGYEVSD
jgi:hypothetical protein